MLFNIQRLHQKTYKGFGLSRAFIRDLSGLIGFHGFGLVVLDSFTGFESHQKPSNAHLHVP
jgi:hypothetical protein